MKSIHVVEETLPKAWEEAVKICWEQGEDFPTEYDQRERGDPPSKDVCALIHVKNPTSDPCIHRFMPSGLDDLEVYVQEVVYGIHDHWISPEEGKWQYTYHKRLFEYDVPGKATVNQIEACIAKLKECGYTRRAQAITWQPWNDIGIADCSCYQRLWLRIENDKLNMSSSIRSNDAFLAAFQNWYAFVELQKYIAGELGVEVGEFVWFANSFHIYGSYFDRFKGFLKTLEERKFEDRVYTMDFAREFFIEGCDKILKEDDLPEDKRELVLQRKISFQNHP